MSGQTYLTVAQVAEQLAISELTVRRRIATGEIPAVKLSTVGRGAIRVPAAGLDRWLDSARIPPAATSTPIREGNAQ